MLCGLSLTGALSQQRPIDRDDLRNVRYWSLKLALLRPHADAPGERPTFLGV